MRKIKNRYLHLLLLLVVEGIYIYLSQVLFAIIIFFTLGSGASASKYPVLQEALWISLLLLPPTIINFYGFVRYKKKNVLNKIANYIIVEISVIACFLLVLSYYGYY